KTFQYTKERGAGPYAVTGVGGQLYSYDKEGNQAGAPGRTARYSIDGLPLEIDQDPSKDGSFVSWGLQYDGLGSRDYKHRSLQTPPPACDPGPCPPPVDSLRALKAVTANESADDDIAISIGELYQRHSTGGAKTHSFWVQGPQ